MLQVCLGQGETVGAALVRDPRVALIAFTGSRDVGCDILCAAAPMSPFSGDRTAFESWATGPDAHVKRVVCGVGGKTPPIVDTADLDEAVLAIRHSALGFQGRRSALSRLIVVDLRRKRPAIQNVVHRLVES